MGFPTFVVGRGMVDSDVLAVDRAISEYDERLYFDRNHETGQWCIYLKTVPQEPDLPIMGFEEIPASEDALRRLYKADALRHGEQILDDMSRRNEDALAPIREKADDAEWQAAEVLEHGFRKMGKHPSPRIYMGG